MTVNVSRGGANLPQKPTPAPNMCWEEIHYFIIYFDYFLDGTNTSNERVVGAFELEGPSGFKQNGVPTLQGVYNSSSSN